jgi:septation ring formation regulator EzrA
MNPLIVTIIIALATFVISIFGASWLNQQAMNKRIDDLRSYLDARFGFLEQTMNARFAAVDARFNAVDARFDAVDARFDSVDNRIDKLEQRVERIERQLDSIFKPVLPRT